MILPAEGDGVKLRVGREAADRMSFPDVLAEFLDLWRMMLDASVQAALFITHAGLPCTTSVPIDEIGGVIWCYAR